MTAPMPQAPCPIVIVPLVPWTLSETWLQVPGCCRAWQKCRTPPAYSNSIAWWSQMSPVPGPTRTCRPPMPLARKRWATQDPVGHVDLVAGLLDQVVAGEPAEQVPVADLVFHFAHAGGLGLAAAAAGHVEVGADEADLAHGPVADLGDTFQIVRLVAALQADARRRASSAGPPRWRPAACGSRGRRRSRVFPGRRACRPSPRRHSAWAGNAAAWPAAPGPRRRGSPAGRRRSRGTAAPAGTSIRGRKSSYFCRFVRLRLQAVGEQVAQGDEFDRALGAQGLAAGAGAAVAAADKADP